MMLTKEQIVTFSTLVGLAVARRCSSRAPAIHTPSGTPSSLPSLVPSGAPILSSHAAAVATPVPATTLVTAQTPGSAPPVASSSSSVAAAAATTTASSSSASSAAPTSPAEVFFGLGTRYGGSCQEEDCWQGGACSFVGYELPEGIDGSTCVSQDIWNNGANCGGCISVTYKGKTIIVMVTNETGGNSTHLDMTPDTWAKLTNGYSGGGVDGIEWEFVTCPFKDQSLPLSIHMHGGASQYWFAATVQDANLRTAKLEVSGDQGATWKATTLKNPNMWILDGTLPSSTAYVRVTSVEGDVVVVKDVVLKSGQITAATENY